MDYQESQKIEKGWIALFRCVEEDELWLLEPFTKAQAWIDLLLLATHDNFTFSIRGNIITVNRGQLARSERYFQERWKWSRNKVRAFFLYLEKVHKIVQQKSRIITMITITKYDNYQQKVQQKVQQKDHRKTTEGTTYNNKNNKNKEKIYKKESWNFESALAEKGVADSFIRDWMKVRKTKKATNTQTAFNRLAKEVEKSGMSWNTVIEHCCSNDWKGFKAEWVKNNNFTRKKGLVI